MCLRNRTVFVVRYGYYGLYESMKPLIVVGAKSVSGFKRIFGLEKFDSF